MTGHVMSAQVCSCGETAVGARCWACGRELTPPRGGLTAEGEEALRGILAMLDRTVQDLTEMRLRCHQAGAGPLGLKGPIETLEAVAERLKMKLEGRI